MNALFHGLFELRSRPWRAVLSGLSVLVGSSAIVAIFAIGSVTKDVFIAASEQIDGRASTYAIDVTGVASAEQLRELIERATALVGDDGGVAVISHSTDVMGVQHAVLARSGEPLVRAPFVMIAGDLTSIRRLPVIDGAWPTTADLPVGIAVNQAAAEQWGGVGTELALLVSRAGASVDGLVQAVVLDGTMEPTIYVALTGISALRSAALGGTVSLYIHQAPGEAQPLGIAQIAADSVGAVADPRTLRQVDRIDEMLRQLQVQQSAFALVALVALATAVIGILNIGLATVSERAKELTIRRAVGATRGQLAAQLLIAAIAIGAIASAVTAVLTVGAITWLGPSMVPLNAAIDPPRVPWEALGWGLLAACGATVVGSLIPAIIASRLEIAYSLRD
ncbi:ABC transporter permease [Salinibacterium sp. ZJ70]|uniref:ABC transporter permease n=1 Tax=Salinibacterium sp. ZJ70 TaxID=2708084 RepID=UPI00141DDEBD|nr:ABC transporter permease [Salinibacterium sp. ZJ70]